MQDQHIIPVILSGGSGTRLWPASRASLPKQLLPMVGERTMLQATIDRLDGVPGIGRPLVVCNEQHEFAVAHQLQAAGHEPHVLLEPLGRNTAPAVAAAALELTAEGADPIMLVLPADHVIRDRAAFATAVVVAAGAAAAGKLATFGIIPTHAETGYGYIERGDEVTDGVFAVDRFVEKPDHDTAEAYLAAGDFLWNSGMFVFTASRFLDELAALEPAMLEAVTAAWTAATTQEAGRLLDPDTFAGCPADSIDYAVMERTGDAVVIPLEAGWSDVGSWSAVREVADQDAAGNVLRGDVVVHDVTNSHIRAESRLVTAAGVDGFAIVETRDAVLVAPLSRSQDVKTVVEALKTDDRPEATEHPFAERSWGRSQRITSGPGYAIEQLEVDPGHELPSGGSRDRNETWVVVRGSGTAMLDAGERSLEPGVSLDVPVGAAGIVRNTGTGPLVVVIAATEPYLDGRRH